MKKATLLLTLTLFACNQTSDQSGSQAKNRRIISLAPSLTEELYLLGKEKEIAGVTTFCLFPPQAKNKEKVGTYLEPNLEKIVALKPDMVITTETQKKETIDRLNDFGIKTYLVPEGNSFQEISKQFLHLAKIVDAEKTAKNILHLSEKKIEDIILRNKKYPRKKVFMQLGGEPLVTCGRDTFVSEIINRAGGINLGSNFGKGYFRINREKIIRENPEIILIVTMGEISGKEIKIWSGYKNLKAVKENRIYLIDADKICRPTITCYREGLETLSAVINQNEK